MASAKNIQFQKANVLRPLLFHCARLSPEIGDPPGFNLKNRVFMPSLHPRSGVLYTERKANMKILFIITTDDGETIYNAMRLANVGVEKGDEVSVFMLGKGVLFERSGTEQFDVMGEMSRFKGDFYV
jgi:uncharacterized protein involved in oxidation of intracellular sulfur